MAETVQCRRWWSKGGVRVTLPDQRARPRMFKVFPLITILAPDNDKAEQILRRLQAVVDGMDGVVSQLDEECYQEIGDDEDVPWEPDSMEGRHAAASDQKRLRYRIYTWRSNLLCPHGLHWPIVWDQAAYPGSWDPPEPPEPWWMCDACGKPQTYGNWRMRLRARLTPQRWVEWRLARMEAADSRAPRERHNDA